MQITKTEALVRSIIGPVRSDIRPLVLSIDLIAELVFNKNETIDTIRITKDVYPTVAKQLGKSPSAVSRKVERLARLCWERGDHDAIARIIGKTVYDISSPRDMLFYLAYYSYLGIPFYKVIEQSAHLSF